MNKQVLQYEHQENPREGWAEAAEAIAQDGDDTLVMGESGNADDSEL